MTVNEAIQILQLKLPVTNAQVKKQYRLLARDLHPDVNHQSDATFDFHRLKEAYETLKSKTEEEINNQIFIPRVDYSQPHKPSINRGIYEMSDNWFVFDLKNFIYFSYKYFKINWLDVFYKFYQYIYQSNPEKLYKKLINSLILIIGLLVGFPMFILMMLASGMFYILNMAPSFIINKQQYWIRQILLLITGLMFEYIVWNELSPIFAGVLTLSVIPVWFIIQISLLYGLIQQSSKSN